MDSDGSAAQFNSVKHNIVSLSPYSCRVREKILYILFIRHGERMVHCKESVLFFAPFKLREVGDDKEFEIVFSAKSEHIADCKTKSAEDSAYRIEFIGAEENEIAGLGFYLFKQLFHFVV